MSMLIWSLSILNWFDKIGNWSILIWSMKPLTHDLWDNYPGYMIGGCHCFKVISHMSEVVYISSFPFSILLKDNKIMKCSTFGMGMAGLIIVFQWLYLYKICHHCKFHSWLLRCKHQPTQCQLFGSSALYQGWIGPLADNHWLARDLRLLRHDSGRSTWSVR